MQRGRKGIADYDGEVFRAISYSTLTLSHAWIPSQSQHFAHLLHLHLNPPFCSGDLRLWQTSAEIKPESFFSRCCLDCWLLYSTTTTITIITTDDVPSPTRPSTLSPFTTFPNLPNPTLHDLTTTVVFVNAAVRPCSKWSRDSQERRYP